jgi:hypothetical protein
MTQKQQRKQSSPRPIPPRRRPNRKRRRAIVGQTLTTGNAVLDAWLSSVRPLAEDLQEFAWPDDDDMRDRT